MSYKTLLVAAIIGVTIALTISEVVNISKLITIII